MRVNIFPFQTSMISEAAGLLAQRHAIDRNRLSALPGEFDNPDEAYKPLIALWERQGTSGAAAVEEGKLAGYLLGEKVVDPLWGRSTWIRPAGCALAPGSDPEIVRDLYAELGKDWVRGGYFFHFAVMPSTNPAILQQWYSLSFGIEQVHALLELVNLSSADVSIPAGVEIRQAGPGDEDILAELSDIIWRHLVKAPVWGIHLPEAGNREGWAALATDPTATVFLATYQGEPAGTVGFWAAEPGTDNLWIPQNCASLSVAGTRIGKRGKGIGTALARFGLAAMYESGYRTCETDWRSTSLLASRFWPRFGFTPAVYRLVRRIDSRIAWANWE